MNESNIPWWFTRIPSEDLLDAHVALDRKSLSQGDCVKEFEYKFSNLEDAKFGVAVTSGTAALTLAGISAGLKPGDEVIIPNRTWIATAHAFNIIGVNIRIAPVNDKDMLINVDAIEQMISDKTRAIVPVSLNGRNVICNKLLDISRKHNLWIIEDAAQGVNCPRPYDAIKRSEVKYCRAYSFSMAKFITTGQGGMILTSDESFEEELRMRRTHGLENVKDIKNWNKVGGNYRMSDVLACIGVAQLKRVAEKKRRLIEVYRFYQKEIRQSNIEQIPVDIDAGEVPIYVECLSRDRAQLQKDLAKHNIDTRLFYPDISNAKYTGDTYNTKKKTIYSTNGIYLPSGDGITNEQLEDVVKHI